MRTPAGKGKRTAGRGRPSPNQKASVEITICKTGSTDYKRILNLDGAKVHDRSRTKATETNNTLTISISADDIPSLCAATNSVLRDILVLTAASEAK
jgi:tRNA threonylcarbamoyladenosine modification (KEOPS) complex  Pcc1 subunit